MPPMMTSDDGINLMRTSDEKSDHLRRHGIYFNEFAFAYFTILSSYDHDKRQPTKKCPVFCYSFLVVVVLVRSLAFCFDEQFQRWTRENTDKKCLNPSRWLSSIRRSARSVSDVRVTFDRKRVAWKPIKAFMCSKFLQSFFSSSIWWAKNKEVKVQCAQWYCAQLPSFVAWLLTQAQKTLDYIMR